MPRYEVTLDEDVMAALERLSQADDRSKPGMLRHLIRAEAVKRGLWTPSKPRAAPELHRKTTGFR